MVVYWLFIDSAIEFQLFEELILNIDWILHINGAFLRVNSEEEIPVCERIDEQEEKEIKKE